MQVRKRKRKSSTGRLILLSINGLFVFFLLLSYLAPYLNPKHFWPIAFFGLAYPLLLILNLGFSLFWLLKRSKVALLSFFFILVGYVPLKKHFGFHAQPSETIIKQRDTTSVRILTYNVHLFRKDDQNPAPETKSAITTLIQSVSPDIVCLQEFYTRKRGKYNTKLRLASDLGLAYSYFQPVFENDYEAFGLIILSRYPIKNAGCLPDYKAKKTLNRVIYADIVKEKKVFRVYNIHLQSIGFQPRDYAFVKDVQNHAFEKTDVASTRRIGGQLKRAFYERSEQAKHVKEEIDRCRKPVIITGDFNDTPLSYAVNTIASNLNNSFASKGQGWGITYNGDFPNFQIDYILSSKVFVVEHYQILKKKLSDHYAVWSDLRL
ncbi:endonuclease/exonuclease/phosphatase family protein [Olivibacter ginsenosidimutans]|uniref:Endonuclease/exonuclease/phosphatase family protein n=1 Tax=Olivibacter ginsenosidimutans TaxID=1176537 RepID=A0ABP9ALE6_9SPHI